MVFTSTQNKENVAVQTSVFQRRHQSTVHRRLHKKTVAPSGSWAKRNPADRIGVARRVVSLGLAIEEPSCVPRVTQSQRKVSLPRYLQRPVSRAISPSALSAVAPDQQNVSIEDVHEKIRTAGQQMLATAAKITATCPTGRLPRELEVITNDISADPPTHVFAVYSQSTTHQKQRIVLHPVHALVLAANCAHLPPLPYSKIAKPDPSEGSVTLPVIPLCLPSPATFPILLAYLYTRRPDHLVASLLPLSPQDDTQTLEQIARRLAASCTISTLLTHVYKVRELWSNVAALGVFDNTLWRAMEAAWEVLLGALALSTGKTWTMRKLAL